MDEQARTRHSPETHLRARRAANVNAEGGGYATPTLFGRGHGFPRAKNINLPPHARPPGDNPRMANGNRMVFLGFGKYARADKIYAIEPIRDERRGHGRRTLVWVEGVSEPIVASRTERTILADMGQEQALGKPILDEALDLAQRLSEQSQSGRVDLADLGRRARHLLEATARPNDPEQLF